jgi:hypothetical protein
MKVVFISPDFTEIIELFRDFPETKEIYKAFLGFKLHLDIENRYSFNQKDWSDDEFLGMYGSYNIYLRSPTNYLEELTYIGKLKMLYLKAQECLSNKWTQEKLEEQLYLLFANCP